MTETEFRAIVSSTKVAVLGAIRRYLAADLRDLIDDVAQDTYVRIYRYIETNGNESIRTETISSLAYVIARNESIRTNKKNRRHHVEVPENIPDMTDRGRTETRRTLQAAFSLLDAELQPVFGLKSEGYSTEEIAERLGLPAGTVKSRMHRARRHLRERSHDWFG